MKFFDSNPQTLSRRLMNLLAILLVIYVTIFVVLYFGQRRILFQPDKHMGEPALYGLSDFTRERVTTADGITITLWQKAPQAGMPTLVYFHGNAANLANRSPKLLAFASAGFGIVAPSYRGYGDSEGSPTEAGLYADAEASIAFATEQLKLPLSTLILYGESLGTGVATEMASRHKVAGLVLEAPYTSTVDRAAEIHPYIPVRLLMKDRFESLNKLQHITAPLLIFHGERDRIIPVHHGRALLQAANQPKRGVFYPDVDHDSFDYAQLVNEMQKLVKEQLVSHPAD